MFAQVLLNGRSTIRFVCRTDIALMRCDKAFLWQWLVRPLDIFAWYQPYYGSFSGSHDEIQANFSQNIDVLSESLRWNSFEGKHSELFKKSHKSNCLQRIMRQNGCHQNYLRCSESTPAALSRGRHHDYARMHCCVRLRMQLTTITLCSETHWWVTFSTLANGGLFKSEFDE